MNTRAVDPTRSRVVLVGTAQYRDDGFEDVPQVAANLRDLAALFRDPQRGGFDEQTCRVAPPDAGVEDVGDLLYEAAGQAEDLLLFYFAGHGLIGHGGELHLCLRNTRLQAPEYSALRFETVRGTFLRSAAANRVVIVDSCYSGRAIGPTLGDPAHVLEQLEISGTYTLTSAPPNRPALVVPGEAHTAFTGRLLVLLHEGSRPDSGPVPLGDVYRRLHAWLRADGLPLPQQRGTGNVQDLVLTRSAAAGSSRRAVPPLPRASIPRPSVPPAGAFADHYPRPSGVAAGGRPVALNPQTVSRPLPPLADGREAQLLLARLRFLGRFKPRLLWHVGTAAVSKPEVDHYLEGLRAVAVGDMADLQAFIATAPRSFPSAPSGYFSASVSNLFTRIDEALKEYIQEVGKRPTLKLRVRKHSQPERVDAARSAFLGKVKPRFLDAGDQDGYDRPHVDRFLSELRSLAAGNVLELQAFVATTPGTFPEIGKGGYFTASVNNFMTDLNKAMHDYVEAIAVVI